MQEVELLPDYSNARTRAVEERLNIFFYAQLYQRNDLTYKRPMRFDNGSVYSGQWNQEGKREGNGVQVWMNGTKYKGEW